MSTPLKKSQGESKRGSGHPYFGDATFQKKEKRGKNVIHRRKKGGDKMRGVHKKTEGKKVMKKEEII